MKKSDRLQLIKELVLRYPIDTQDEIVERLKEAGVVATQATVSRDIKELGIIKVPSESGYIYGFSKTNAAKLQISNIRQLSTMNNMVNLRLVPGSATVLKRQILEFFADEIFSIIADDDSILLIVKDEAVIPQMEQTMKVW
ncbi:arginine repressor [Streptococcus gallinaceus]|uniref:Arginine repressor n=1 Tax=Streptococcus gallinaceus TaxID=165758 RepID=A0ABV2JJQ2_9STRE|nr:arginine repressor [Streptococcus gallinaceus]MCP1638879.1 transcriptional regulator of arginine metabolism [Streptococcus gallinaceus]MCP1769877.1 transcriptional regulator of arginine metabolism [Streptococcus gallinaceus]